MWKIDMARVSESLSEHGMSVLVLVVLDVVYLLAVIYVFRFPNVPEQLKEVMVNTFCGWNGALGLALNSRATMPREPRPDYVPDKPDPKKG